MLGQKVSYAIISPVPQHIVLHTCIQMQSDPWHYYGSFTPALGISVMELVMP